MLNEGASLQARVVVVAFAPPDSLIRYQRALGLDDVLVLSDVDRDAYHAFAFGRASVRRVWLDPRVWIRYAALLGRGRRPQAVHDDSLQLGGDVLADRSGRVRWIHRSTGPEDRPTVTAVADEIERL